MSPNCIYKYMEQEIDRHKMHKILKIYYRRVELLLQTEANDINMTLIIHSRNTSLKRWFLLLFERIKGEVDDGIFLTESAILEEILLTISPGVLTILRFLFSTRDIHRRDSTAWF